MYERDADRLTIFRQDTRIPPFQGERPPTVQRPAASGIVFFLFLFCVLGGGYVFMTYKSPIPLKNEQQTVAPRASAAETIPVSESDDLVRHLNSSQDAIVKAVEELNQSRKWIGKTLPALDRNYLGTERTWLQSAIAAVDAAHRAAEQARQDEEIAKNILIERRKP